MVMTFWLTQNVGNYWGKRGTTKYSLSNTLFHDVVYSGACSYTTSVNGVANFAFSMMHSIGVLSLSGNAIYSHCT